MGDGLKRASHAARCTQPRSLYLTKEQRDVLAHCLLSTRQRDDWDDRTKRIFDDLSYKLDDNNYRR